MRIYYTTGVVILLHVSSIYCDHLQGFVFNSKDILQRTRKHRPDDDHNTWPKHVGGLRRLWCNKFTYLHMRFLVLFS